jgi:hypothetical protein
MEKVNKPKRMIQLGLSLVEKDEKLSPPVEKSFEKSEILSKITLESPGPCPYPDGYKVELYEGVTVIKSVLNGFILLGVNYDKTEKALKFSSSKHNKGMWFPKSQLRVVIKIGDLPKFYAPPWIMKTKGIVGEFV